MRRVGLTGHSRHKAPGKIARSVASCVCITADTACSAAAGPGQMHNYYNSGLQQYMTTPMQQPMWMPQQHWMPQPTTSQNDHAPSARHAYDAAPPLPPEDNDGGNAAAADRLQPPLPPQSDGGREIGFINQTHQEAATTSSTAGGGSGVIAAIKAGIERKRQAMAAAAGSTAGGLIASIKASAQSQHVTEAAAGCWQAPQPYSQEEVAPPLPPGPGEEAAAAAVSQPPLRDSNSAQQSWHPCQQYLVQEQGQEQGMPHQAAPLVYPQQQPRQQQAEVPTQYPTQLSYLKQQQQMQMQQQVQMHHYQYQMQQQHYMSSGWTSGQAYPTAAATQQLYGQQQYLQGMPGYPQQFAAGAAAPMGAAMPVPLRQALDLGTAAPSLPPATTSRLKPVAAAAPSPVVVDARTLLRPPGRESRPRRILIILRGLPGSGKSHLARLVREAEAEHGGAAAQPPRILSLDEYFITVRDA